MQIFTDDDLPDAALDAILPAIRDFLIAHAREETQSPARLCADMGDGALVFTAGGDAHHLGFRVYDTAARPQAAQLVAVWSRATGQIVALAPGTRLGPLRTGAIGALAAADLAPHGGPLRVGVIGSGVQADTQIAALSRLRMLADLRIWSTTPAHAERLAMRRGGQVAGSARAAVEGADVVILATSASTPVIAPEWISPDTHVTTLGPKFQNRHEMPTALADRAALIVSDSPAQIAAQDRHMLAGHPALARLAPLGAWLDGRARPEGITLFLSAGLAGTEVAALAALIQARA